MDICLLVVTETAMGIPIYAQDDHGEEYVKAVYEYAFLYVNNNLYK